MRPARAGIHAAVRRARVHVALVTGLAVYLLAWPNRPNLSATIAPVRPVSALLDAYSHGDYDAVVADLASRPESVAHFTGALRDVAASWIRRDALEVPRRRLVVATVALEAARGLKPNPEPRNYRPELQWYDRLALLEWACGLTRQTPVPIPAERWWHLAAVALLEESYGPPFYAFETAWRDGPHHISHAEARFPGEPRWALARAVIAEEGTGSYGAAIDNVPNPALGTSVRVVETQAEADLLLVGKPASAFPTDPRHFLFQLRQAVRGFSALRASTVVGTEADLRFGAIEVRINQPDLALPHLDASARSATEPFLRYAGQFFRGAALTRLGQVQAAEDAFQRALAEIPHAESATSTLAWLFATNGHAAEASALVGASLAAPRPDLDPLTLYRLGDTRLWPFYLAELRKGLTP